MVKTRMLAVLLILIGLAGLPFRELLLGVFFGAGLVALIEARRRL